ncbi:MAG TPA: LPS export ABC transporter periplasmic protein LptC [Candidatus Omnitrophota bacterium]|nr:LPS export ABC transporter periplasmic protein LptC [Candidatus Omnitrophota bacterium]HPD84993.1 LPS export ABC transporter periplasmic protein LptC [Candidatus Omnitrophota bacterium]HRZ03851.1 LPS export ABC transporter periplasmic protein LptC [Candidatus Omnitrophota bacterium]
MIRNITLAFLILLSGGVLIRAEDSSQPAAQQSNQQFQGFDLAGYKDGGQKAWDIKGDRADILGDIIKLTDIVANAYGEEQMNLTAKSGTIDKVSGKMHLQDDVVVTTQTGSKLVTDSLDWEREKNVVTTPDKVVLTREGMKTTGTGAIAHPGLNTAQINENVTVTVDTDPKKKDSNHVTITCDGPLEVDYATGNAVFNNNVVAIEGERKLTADKMEVFFDKEAKQIKEMICTGHVSISMGQNTSYSEKAIYKAAEQKLLLIGTPKLIFYTQGDDAVLPLTDTESQSSKTDEGK